LFLPFTYTENHKHHNGLRSIRGVVADDGGGGQELVIINTPRLLLLPLIVSS